MAEDWTFEALDAEIDDIRHRVLQHGRFLASYFVGRDTEAELMLLAAATQEPLLFAGSLTR